MHLSKSEAKGRDDHTRADHQQHQREYPNEFSVAETSGKANTEAGEDHSKGDNQPGGKKINIAEGMRRQQRVVPAVIDVGEHPENR